MNIYCIGYNSNNVFACDIVIDSMFNVVAGSSKDFTDKLYSSMNSYLDGNITLVEFIDDVEKEFGFRPTLIIPPSSLAEDSILMDDEVRERIFDSMIKVGNVNTGCTFIPITMCEYVL
jgi:hypothetical protein